MIYPSYADLNISFEVIKWKMNSTRDFLFKKNIIKKSRRSSLFSHIYMPPKENKALSLLGIYGKMFIRSKYFSTSVMFVLFLSYLGLASNVSFYASRDITKDSLAAHPVPSIKTGSIDYLTKPSSDIIPLDNVEIFSISPTPILSSQNICSRDGCLPPKLISSVSHPILGKFYEKDIQCMAQNIYFESKNQGEDGMIATAEIVLSRMQSDLFPRQLCEVIYEKNNVTRKGKPVSIYQFSWVGEGNKGIDYESQAWSDSLRIAREMLSGKKSNLTKGALFYHADYIKPNWDFRKLKRVAKVGNHIYYKFIVDGITFATPMNEVRKMVKEKELENKKYQHSVNKLVFTENKKRTKG